MPRAMKNILTILLLAACGVCAGQNLVVNPSFEDTVSCPIAPEEIYKCAGWTSYGGSPDYMNPCSPPPSAVSVPSNWGGYQQPASGSSYCAFMTFHSLSSNAREFVGGNLTSPLVIGTKYFVSFKIVLSINSDLGSIIASNKMGAMFSTVPHSTNSFNYALITNNPPVYTNSLVIDTTNWTTISGSFIADSFYTHIIIGNFFADSLTDTIQLASSFLGDAYYYLDDVCVSTDSLACNTLVGIQQLKQNSDVSFFPNPFSTQLTFTLSDNEPTTLSLYNFLGQQILQQAFTSSTTINTGAFAEGIYFYELRNSKKIIGQGKVVKQ
jgi:hypothetical protein